MTQKGNRTFIQRVLFLHRRLLHIWKRWKRLKGSYDKEEAVSLFAIIQLTAKMKECGCDHCRSLMISAQNRATLFSKGRVDEIPELPTRSQGKTK